MKAEKKQTAMQELIGAIEANMSNLPITDRYRIGLEHCKREAEQLLEKEKEQIVDAWDLGRRYIDHPVNGEQSYNETYKQD